MEVSWHLTDPSIVIILHVFFVRFSQTESSFWMDVMAQLAFFKKARNICSEAMRANFTPNTTADKKFVVTHRKPYTKTNA